MIFRLLLTTHVMWKFNWSFDKCKNCRTRLNIFFATNNISRFKGSQKSLSVRILWRGERFWCRWTWLLSVPDLMYCHLTKYSTIMKHCDSHELAENSYMTKWEMRNKSLWNVKATIFCLTHLWHRWTAFKLIDAHVIPTYLVYKSRILKKREGKMWMSHTNQSFTSNRTIQRQWLGKDYNERNFDKSLRSKKVLQWRSSRMLQ